MHSFISSSIHLAWIIARAIQPSLEETFLFSENFIDWTILFSGSFSDETILFHEALPMGQSSSQDASLIGQPPFSRIHWLDSLLTKFHWWDNSLLKRLYWMDKPDLRKLHWLDNPFLGKFHWWDNPLLENLWQSPLRKLYWTDNSLTGQSPSHEASLIGKIPFCYPTVSNYRQTVVKIVSKFIKPL